METIKIIRCALSVAGKCTNCKNFAGVVKTVAVDFLPQFVDYVDELAAARRYRQQQELDQAAFEEACSKDGLSDDLLNGNSLNNHKANPTD